MSTILDGLNEAQKHAVTAGLGHTLVLAGAGSGKTRALVSRIAWLIEKHQIHPASILAVTFTNKAAGEMKSRLNDMIDAPVQSMWVGTFHGICHRLLRRHFREANLPEHFHIMDSDDQARMIKRVIASLNLDESQWPVKQAQSFINRHKDEGERPEHIHVLSYGPGRTLLSIYQAYEQACQVAGVIDFAELLLRAHETLRKHPELLSHYQQRFLAILVDEFQDTNGVQYALIRLLAGGGASVTAVGDDDQSIYGWRGAKIENIQRFNQDFPNVSIIRLEQNYRSTAVILNAANAVIANNADRMGKNLWTNGQEGEPIALYGAYNELEEARFVSDRITMAIEAGMNPDDMAILYRSNAQSRVLEEALLRAGIAYRIHGGLRFFDRAEIKDAMAYLRLTLNQNDDAALLRVINLPARGIGEKTLVDVRLRAKEQAISLWQASVQILDEQLLPKRAANALEAFIRLIDKMKADITDLPLEEQLSYVLEASGLYQYYLQLKSDKAESKADNLQELVNAAREFRYDDEHEDMNLLTAFIAHAALEAGEMQANIGERHVHLMTLHAAKGLEFPWVFLVGMEEGVFPGRQSIEEPDRLLEERRLCYVGMTRAMQRLFISYAEVRRQYGREEYHRPSRFISEIPSHLIDELRHGSYQKPSKQVTKSSGGQQGINGWYVGQGVVHGKFGEGVILGFEGSGAHARVLVRFSSHGEKWLVLAYANLVS